MVHAKITRNTTGHETSSFIQLKALMKVLRQLEKRDLITFVVPFVNKNIR